MMDNKTSCILFKTVFDAALKLTEDNQPDLALDILLSYGKYAFGYTEGVEAKSLTAEIIVNQNLPSLDAANRRYNAAVENGNKGKEYGKLGGRPKKGETKEEAKKRRETPVKPQNKPQSEPLTVAVDVSDSVSKDVSLSNTIELSDKDKTIELLKKEKTLVLDEKTKEERNTKKEESPVTGEKEYESREEIIDKYYKYIVKTLPVLEKDRCTGLTDEENFSPDTLTWAEEQDFGFIYNLFRNWESGGREKFTEIVQGCSTTPAVFDIIFYSLHTIKCMNTARA